MDSRIIRADVYLTENGFADSRTRAAKLIASNGVTVDGKKITKASEPIDGSVEHRVEISDAERYVSRGGLKLERALDAFGISVAGMICADIGASTGGFTDCLLQRGAERVFAFDSGHGQFHPKIASDRRVISKEGFNARYIKPEDIGRTVDIAVMDVSFISATCIIPALSGVIAEGGRFVSLIKPQFEAGREGVGKNGIVKSAAYREASVRRVLASAMQNKLKPIGLITSPILGGDGNAEYLAAFVKTAEIPTCDINAFVRESFENGRNK